MVTAVAGTEAVASRAAAKSTRRQAMAMAASCACEDGQGRRTRGMLPRIQTCGSGGRRVERGLVLQGSGAPGTAARTASPTLPPEAIRTASFAPRVFDL